jgi:hypothetical protein
MSYHLTTIKFGQLMLCREEAMLSLRIRRHAEIQNEANVFMCDGKLYVYYRGDLGNYAHPVCGWSFY